MHSGFLTLGSAICHVKIRNCVEFLHRTEIFANEAKSIFDHHSEEFSRKQLFV